MTVYGGVEAGGTKFVCAAAEAESLPELVAETTIPTSGPEETIGAAIQFFRDVRDAHGPISGIGIGSFGPLDLDPKSNSYGHITTTPKPGWPGADLLGPMREGLAAEGEASMRFRIDTDVNAAALAEWLWGSAVGIDDFIYVTVGTGIGGGGMINGELTHGLGHPEMGHVSVPRHPTDDFEGACLVHRDYECLEGFASGLAIQKRWGRNAEELVPDHPAWDLEVHYLSYGLGNLVLSLSPRLVILGGGVMHTDNLRQRVEERIHGLYGGYVPTPRLAPPHLGDRAGVLGAIALAADSASGPRRD